MLRPPRRRKQQQQQQQQTRAKAQLLESSLPDDEEFSFASSPSVLSTTTLTNEMPSSKIAGPKHIQKATSSRRSAIKKEQYFNDENRSERLANHDHKCSDVAIGLLQQQTSTKNHTEIDSKSTMLDPVEDISGSLKELTLGRISPDESTINAAIFPPLGFGAKNIAISVSDDEKPRCILLKALRLIEKSNENDLVWSLFKVPATVDAVASASWSLGPPEYMILEENSTKVINIAKQCLKSLSSLTSSNTMNTKSSKTICDGGAKDDLEMALLRVALYSLRSVLPILIESEKDQSKLQVVVKLFYHCVVISGDACHRAFQTFAASPPQEKNVLKVMSYAMICLGAYEGLGTCTILPGKKPMAYKRGAVAWDKLLPIIGQDDKAIQAMKKILPQTQVVRIAMESSLCASSSLLNLSLVSLRVGAHEINELWTIPDEFHFVSSVIVDTCSGVNQKCPMFQQLLSHVACPYVMQSLFVTTDEYDSLTFDADALRHVTKVFRILWDGATSVEEVCSVSNSMALKMCCFKLRENAILIILRTLKSVFAQVLPTEQIISTSVKELYSLFDRASISAIKSVGLFDKALGNQEKKNALIHFHDNVGNAFDYIALQFCSGRSRQEEIRLPSSYYEYCVYRSIHRWRLLGFVSEDISPHLCYGKSAALINSNDADSLVGIHTFTIIHMVLRAFYHLQMETNTVQITDSDCQQAIANFNDVVINNASPSSHSRCKSLLSMLDIHREATKIILKDLAGNAQTGKEHHIALLASVIGNCFAPLDSRMSLSTKDRTKCLNFCLSCADCGVKSASLFGIASDFSTPMSTEHEQYSTQADTQLRKSYEILMTEIGRLEKKNVHRKAPPVLAIELFAKAASILGRRRVDRKEILASLEPQMLATEMLSRVAIKATDEHLFNTYQLPNRYIQLSSSLDALGCTEESIGALAMAAYCTLELLSPSSEKTHSDSKTICDNISKKILLFPENVILDSASQSSDLAEDVSPITKRLIRAYIEYGKSLTNKSQNDANPIQDSILHTIRKNTFIEEVLEAASASRGGRRSHFGSIRLSRLLDFVLWNPTLIDRVVLTSEKIIFLHDVLRSTTKVAKTISEDDDSLFLLIIEEVNEFITTQKKRFVNMLEPDSVRELISTFHVIVAGHLVESRIMFLPKPTSWVLRQSSITERELMILQQACIHLKQAKSQLEDGDSNQCVSYYACNFARLAAVQLLLAIFSEHLSLAETEKGMNSESSNALSLLKSIESVTEKYTLTLSACSHAIDKLAKLDQNYRSAVVESLAATMKRLLRWFLSRSDPTSSADCFSLLQKVYSFEVLPNPPLDSLSDLFLVSAKFDDLVPIFRRHFDPQILLDSEHSQIDSVIKKLMISLHTPFESSGMKTTDDMQTLLCNSDACEGSTYLAMDKRDDFDSTLGSETNLMLQKQMLVTSMLMLHAKLHIGAGRPSTAVNYLNLCRANCRDMLNCLRSAHCRVNSLILDDIAIQVDDILTSCYERSAVAFYLQGIRRKAEDFALMSAMRIKVLNIKKFGQVNMQDLMDSFERNDGQECILSFIRSLMKVKFLSTPPDTIISQRLIERVDWIDGSDTDDEAFYVNRLLTKSKNVLAYDELFRHVPTFRSKSSLAMGRLCDQLRNYLGHDHATELVPSTVLAKRACIELKTRIYCGFDSGKTSIDSACESLSSQLEEITQSSLSTGIANSEAYYELGLIALREARTRGELQELWNEDTFSNESTHCFTANARKLFSQALTMAPPASFILTKNILRCLALVTGPTDEQGENSLATVSLINISVGATSRNIVRDGIREGEVFDAFQAFDDESLDHKERVKSVSLFINRAASLIPNNWNITTMATCPTGELLISSIRVLLGSGGERFVECSTACIFPAFTDEPAEGSQSGLHADLLIPLRKIIDRSQNQLRGINEEVQHDEYDEKSKRRHWWKERRSIDDDLESLLRHAERTYFTHDVIRQKLIPDSFVFSRERQSNSSSDDDSSECSDLGPGNLESKFEAAESEHQHPIPFNKEAERLKLSKLTVATIKSKLASINCSSANTKKKNKAELIDLLVSEMENDCGIAEAASPSESSATRSGENSQDRSCDAFSDQVLLEPCTILILDEHLHSFPFESMDMLTDMAITRVPSLPFVLAAITEAKSIYSSNVPIVDPRNVKYVVDPESNLSESASTLGPALTLMASKNGWEWEGVVGEMPSSQFMASALARENGLYLYCGHGGGEKSFSRSQVEEFMTSENGTRGCQTPVVLMGCSSGRLQSVNTPKEYSSEHDFIMHYEPEGIALSYLYAGAPCVVGNLWDVTDRDIDRYCLTLMEDFLLSTSDDSPRENSPSLAKCVASARRACKLRYIVGSAPVCYGVPVVCSTT